MEPPRPQPAEVVEPLDRSARLQLAGLLFRTYHARCFWHCPRDLVVTESDLPLIIRGLRTHGGREGFRLAAKLRIGPAALDGV